MIKYCIWVVFYAGFLSLSCASSGKDGDQSGTNSTAGNHTTTGHEKARFQVATFDYDYVKGPFVIVLWILIASFAKLGFHFSQRLSSIIPESSLVILLGVVIGVVLRIGNLTHDDVPFFSSRIFFLFMLPPIVLEAGYFLQDRAFFDNIGTILLFAVVGTLFNAFAVGFTLYFLTRSSVGLHLMPALVFGSLIAAVDPVAVLAVFEEVNVNVMLYIIVFGESLLNDAVTVVLYHLFEKMAQMDEVTYKEVLLGFANFLVVSIGGTLMGVVWGIATGFTTKYTDHVRVIEPIFVFIMSYMSYLCAEMFHLSGIMSIVTCGIVMKPYVEMNISRKSHVTIKYFMKMLSSCSETLIFMFLGIALVVYNHQWNTTFVLLTILFISVYRSIGVVSLTYLLNKFGRLNKLSAVDQFIMSYGGIRGAVSFSLVILLDKGHFPNKDMLVTTTIVVVMFTIFVQGITIKPLVKGLNVQLRKDETQTMYAELNDKLLEHLVAGIEEISGFRGHGYYWALMEHIHLRYLRTWLIRDDDSDIQDKDILLAYRKLEYKDALTHLEREGSGTLLFTKKANTEGEDEDEQLLLRGGSLVRCPDAVLKDKNISTEPSDLTFENTHQTLSSILAHSKKTYSHRKFQRNNIIEEYDTPSYLMPPQRRTLRYIPIPSDLPERPKHKRRHRRKRGGHKKHDYLEGQPPKKKLSTIYEPAEGELHAEKKQDEDHKQSEQQKDEDKSMAPISEEDPGITFNAPRWRLGRFPSQEETEMDSQINWAKNIDSPSGARKTSPGSGGKETIPLVSFVVNMEDNPPETRQQGEQDNV